MASKGMRQYPKPTNNPFMSTSASLVGQRLDKKVEYHAPEADTLNQTAQSTKGVVEYMYQTSSTVVGEGIERGNSRLSQQMDKTTVHQAVQQNAPAGIKKISTLPSPSSTLLRPSDFVVDTVDMSKLSKARSEHPMYSTSTRAIGEEKTEMQIANSAKGIPNGFTNSFNGIRYRNYGLNTNISKSKVCKDLDV